MSRADVTLARLLALLPWLRAHPGVTFVEVCEKFEITADELRRDLAMLTFSGHGRYGRGLSAWCAVRDRELLARLDGLARQAVGLHDARVRAVVAVADEPQRFVVGDGVDDQLGRRR